ncbi:MAG TPA: heparinase II/III family protein, partial [Methylomirabilota bacterium]|nr:heparinase II/III family protein [Methylomirabilota bacterium]
NGRGATSADQLATVLAHDDARGQPVLNASHSGYQRIETDGVVLLMEAGAPPPLAVSGAAHAGFLSFELSSGGHRFVVNCGTVEDDDRWRQIARATAAHSTVTVEDTSSARFIQADRLRRRLGTLMMQGPSEVLAVREERDGGSSVVARHDGYAASFGFVHQRSLLLSADGNQLIGSDRLIPTSGRVGAKDRFAVRFHLHPGIRATRTSGGDILMVAADGEAWTLSCAMIEPELGESIFLSTVHGRRKSAQVVIQGRARVTPEVAWSLTRTGRGRTARSSRPRGGGAAGDLFD